jgi:hypothetical protein
MIGINSKNMWDEAKEIYVFPKHYVGTGVDPGFNA